MPKENENLVVEFFKAILSDWLTGMSGALSVPFAFLGIMNTWSQKWLFFILAIIALFITSWRLWLKERGKNKKLEEELYNLKKEKAVDPEMLFKCFREFIEQRDSSVAGLIRLQILDDESINKWYTKTREGLQLALGKNFSNEIVMAPLELMKSKIDNLRGHIVGRGHRVLILKICQEELGRIKENVKPELVGNFIPSNLKFYEI